MIECIAIIAHRSLGTRRIDTLFSVSIALSVVGQAAEQKHLLVVLKEKGGGDFKGKAMFKVAW